jgi:hypothetical protein
MQYKRKSRKLQREYAISNPSPLKEFAVYLSKLKHCCTLLACAASLIATQACA